MQEDVTYEPAPAGWSVGWVASARRTLATLILDSRALLALAGYRGASFRRGYHAGPREGRR